ncbi:hypothetical protein DPMN_174610 [Dreissena polymorpha]|uniref:Uncharacterized protein n=1 Tax=Dreissena polymorpha TaxID=45954 RepID=A0A9D4E7S6_DREPO|nr:hypothetical protein DPMN_174610 [Dreissena polymorpha]
MFVGTIFELIQDIMGTNLLIKFHDDRTINVASRVLKRFYYSNIRKNDPHPGGHVFQPTGTIFDSSDNKWKNLRKNDPLPGGHVFQPTGTNFELTKFHEDRTIHVASRVLTRQMLTPHNARRTKGDHKSSP